jgi:uncharacterized protein YcnI
MTMKTLTTLLLTGAASLASAHVVLVQPQAPAGSAYTAALRVGHGCEGSPTHTVTVQVPDGLRGAKPQPKPGWTLTVRKAPLAQPSTSHGRSITEDVVEVRWQAQSREAWLDDAWFDEFNLRGQLPAQAGPLWFRVQQLCETGQLDWSEVPDSGTSTQGLKAPAALLQVQPAQPTQPTQPAKPASHQH